MKRMYRLPSYSEIEPYVFEHFEFAYRSDFSREELKKSFHPYNDFEESFRKIPEPRWYEWKDYRFPVFIYDPSIKAELLPGYPLPFDPVLNAFLFLSGWQEWNNDKRDQYGRFPYEQSLQAKYNFTAVPVVSIYFALLADKAAESGLNITKTERRNIAFSHDIDRLYSGWMEELGHLLRNFSFRHLRSFIPIFLKRTNKTNDPYFRSMQDLLTIERKNNIRALYFFLASKNKKDADYHIDSPVILRLLKQVKTDGHSIGLHPGLGTFKDKTKLAGQKQALERALGNQKDILRQHFLQYDSTQTPEIQKQCGFATDYSLGFAEFPGFRNGSCLPFYTFNFEKGEKNQLLEIPLFFMDGTLSHYLKNDRQQNFDFVMNELDKIRKHFSFDFSILFHNTVFTEYKYKGFTAFYLRLLSWVKEKEVTTEI